MPNHVQRRQREKNELRLKILDAARELFALGGEQALTLRAVAEKIEYSPTTIYQHFADKNALLLELCATDFLEASRVFKQAERIGDPVERLQKVAAAYFDFAWQRPGHYRLMFLPSTSEGTGLSRSSVEPTAPPVTPAGSDASLPGPYPFLQSAVFKAMAAGCFRPEHRDVAAITQLLWSGLHGVVTLQLVRAKHPEIPWKPAETSGRMMVRCLLVGLLEPRFAAALLTEDT